jgi:hypothetical protein
MKSNYEQMKKQMQSHFLEFDQEKMIQKFSLACDEDWLYLNFVGRPHRVNRRTGLVEWSDNGFADAVEADYNGAMSVYDVLCCSKDECRLSGEFVSVNNLPGIVAGARSGSGMFDGSARYFDGKTEALSRALVRLGGTPVPQGDVGFQLKVFDFLPVIFRFWESDAEFPPSLSLLWDRNLLSFIHYETSYFIAGHMMSRLKELMQEVQP